MKNFKKFRAGSPVDNSKNKERLFRYSSLSEEKLYEELAADKCGLTQEEVCASREKYGANVIAQSGKYDVFKRIASAFLNPFTAILVLLAVVSVFTDIVTAAPG